MTVEAPRPVEPQTVMAKLPKLLAIEATAAAMTAVSVAPIITVMGGSFMPSYKQE